MDLCLSVSRRQTPAERPNWFSSRLSRTLNLTPPNQLSANETLPKSTALLVPGASSSPLPSLTPFLLNLKTIINTIQFLALCGFAKRKETGTNVIYTSKLPHSSLHMKSWLKTNPTQAHLSIEMMSYSFMEATQILVHSSQSLFPDSRDLFLFSHMFLWDNKPMGHVDVSTIATTCS